MAKILTKIVPNTSPTAGGHTGAVVISVDGDPSKGSGTACPPTAIALYNNGSVGRVYYKHGTNDTDWTEFSRTNISPVQYDLSNSVDGERTIFTLPVTALNSKGILVTARGLIRTCGVDYTATKNSITFMEAPRDGSTLTVYYMPAGGGSISPILHDLSSQADGERTEYSLPKPPADVAGMLVMVRGLGVALGSDYTVSGSTVTFNKAPSANSKVLAYYVEA